MDYSTLVQLALSLTARVFSQLASACPVLDVLTLLVLTDDIMHNQTPEHTAIDVIVASRKYLQLQLPQRAQSLRKPGETAQMGADRRHIEELSRDGDPFFNPLGMTTQEQAQVRNMTTQCADGSWW